MREKLSCVAATAILRKLCGTLFTSRNVNSTSNNTNLIPLGNAYRPGLLLQDNDGHNTGSVRGVSSHRIRKQYIG